LTSGRHFSRDPPTLFGLIEEINLIAASIRRESGSSSMPETQKAMGFEDDLRRIDEHIAEARRIVQRQKGLIIRLRGAGASTWDAQGILWLLESNLRRLQEHRDLLRANAPVQHRE
jgi:hypothetical protein